MSLKDILAGIFKKPAPPDAPQPAREARTDVPDRPAADTAAPREPESPSEHWVGKMVPRSTGPGETINRSDGGGVMSCASVRLEWVSRQVDAQGVPLRVRTPESTTAVMPKTGFTAAGKRYRSLSNLAYRWEGSSSYWATDLYGRDVLMVAEQFPCFDSSDYLYENRYFRWFFLCEDEKLTCVCHIGTSDNVTVTEDVQDLETKCWQEMKKQGCFSPVEDSPAK